MPTIFEYDNLSDKTLSIETRKQIALQIKEDIDEYCVKTFTDEHRHHLGASIIGDDCSRFIWYSFRWVKYAVFNGRMLRLFDRGNKEEERIIRWLRGIGLEIWEVDQNTGKQFRIWGVRGHFGGSQDAGAKLPYLNPELPILLEFKTHNTKSFSNLVNKGVILAKPSHYSQMCSYGKFYNFQYGLYCAVNKNDDDLHFELVELDWKRSHSMLMKADDIIHSQKPPPRIADNPSFYKCRDLCTMKDICWNSHPVDINCRSCQFASPADDAEWYCNRYKQIIPKDFIAKGCPGHVSIAI